MANDAEIRKMALVRLTTFPVLDTFLIQSERMCSGMSIQFADCAINLEPDRYGFG